MDELFATDVAYSAGLFDGEGTVGVYNQSDGGLRLTVQVAMCDKGPPEKLQQMYGGGLSYVSRGPEKSRVWVWNICTGKAAAALEYMLPYLMNKKEQAVVALEFQKTITLMGTRGHSGDGRKLAPEVHRRRKDPALQLKQLKKRPIEEVVCGTS